MATGHTGEELEFIGMMLRKLREKMNYTQEEMAYIMNIDRSAVSRYENATRVIPADILLAYARVFHVPVSKFFPSACVEHTESDFPNEYYVLNLENQKIVLSTMAVLINGLLSQQKDNMS